MTRLDIDVDVIDWDDNDSRFDLDKIAEAVHKTLLKFGVTTVVEVECRDSTQYPYEEYED